MEQQATYEALVARFGASSQQVRDENLAINERGGHCKKCFHCRKLTAVLPPRYSHLNAHQANYSVRVSCEIDEPRIYPHPAHFNAEDCGSIKRLLRLEASQFERQAAA